MQPLKTNNSLHLTASLINPSGSMLSIWAMISFVSFGSAMLIKLLSGTLPAHLCLEARTSDILRLCGSSPLTAIHTVCLLTNFLAQSSLALHHDPSLTRSRKGKLGFTVEILLNAARHVPSGLVFSFFPFSLAHALVRSCLSCHALCY